jgi:hypothetical protein
MIKTNLKVGDNVRVIGGNSSHDKKLISSKKVGTIVDINDINIFPIRVFFNHICHGQCVYEESCLQKVESKKENKPKKVSVKVSHDKNHVLRKEFKYGWGVSFLWSNPTDGSISDGEYMFETESEAHKKIEDLRKDENIKQIYLFKIGKVWKVVTKPYQLEEI